MSNTNGVNAATGSTVKVIKSRNTQQVVNISSRNANEAWVMVQSSAEVFRGGRLFTNIRTGFLRGTAEKLQSMGFSDGKELPGRIVIQDSLVPIMKDNADFGLRIPQSKVGVAYTPAIGTAIRTACTTAGVTYEGVDSDGVMKPLYRKVFYSPYPEGHAGYEADVLIPIANQEEVANFINTITLPATTGSNGGADSGMNSAKAARLAELKAIPKAKRSAPEKEELSELLEELEG